MSDGACKENGKGHDDCLILLTNDDGVRSPGIHALKRSLDSLGRIVIVAPDGEKSASSNAVTLNRPMIVKQLEANVFSVKGLPADCVFLALRTILSQKPDIVISGINLGPNLGFDTFFSGTVAGARVACFSKISAFAISEVRGNQDNLHRAGTFARRITEKILHHGLPRGVFLNVNVPTKVVDEAAPFRIAPLGDRVYNDAVNDLMVDGQRYCTIVTQGLDFNPVPGSDCDTVHSGYVSVTPLSINATADAHFDLFNGWTF